MKHLHKQLEQSIIKQQANNHYCNVPYRLMTAFDGTLVEHYISAQQKADGECKRKSHQKCGNMRLEGDETQIPVLFMKNEVVTNVIYQQVEHLVGTTTGRIAKGLLWHKPVEGRVEKINQLHEPTGRLLAAGMKPLLGADDAARHNKGHKGSRIDYFCRPL
jgi:hypothetical protein